MGMNKYYWMLRSATPSYTEDTQCGDYKVFDSSMVKSPALLSNGSTWLISAVLSKSSHGIKSVGNHHPPTPHTSSPTHSNVTVSPCLWPESEHSGSFAKVGHQAEEPSRSVSSRYNPYFPSLNWCMSERFILWSAVKQLALHQKIGTRVHRAPRSHSFLSICTHAWYP